jgi:hypothetical protein
MAVPRINAVEVVRRPAMSAPGTAHSVHGAPTVFLASGRELGAFGMPSMTPRGARCRVRRDSRNTRGGVCSEASTADV